jgi:molecular chaperone DnaK
MQPSDIDHVVLVGGSTRIPKVRVVLAKKFGFEPKTCGNVDECVALGAALFAAKGRRVLEVCNHGYGTLALIEDPLTAETRVGNSIVIPKNTPIPCSMSRVYQTSEDNEELIEVDVTQGEDNQRRYVDVIGRITLKVPAGRPAGCQVRVTYSYDENQRVKATILDEESGKAKEVAIDYKGRGVLTDKQISRKSAYLKQVRIE